MSLHKNYSILEQIEKKKYKQSKEIDNIIKLYGGKSTRTHGHPRAHVRTDDVVFKDILKFNEHVSMLGGIKKYLTESKMTKINKTPKMLGGRSRGTGTRSRTTYRSTVKLELPQLDEIDDFVNVHYYTPR